MIALRAAAITAPVIPASVPTTTTAASTSANLSRANQAAAAGPVLSMITTGQPGEACSPGGLASLIGTNLTSAPTQRSISQPLTTQLAGVQVLVNGVPAPLLLASNTQINFQCPVLAQGTAMQIEIESTNGALTAPLQTVMQPAVPLLFQMDASGRGLVSIAGTNEIAMTKTEGVPSRPAVAGDNLIVHASGLGEVVDGVAVGIAAPLNRPIATKNQIKLVIGEIEIDPEFAGLAPGTVGVYQVNASVDEPSAGGRVRSGIHQDHLSMDGTILKSNTVTMAIGERDEVIKPNLRSNSGGSRINGFPPDFRLARASSTEQRDTRSAK